MIKKYLIFFSILIYFGHFSYAQNIDSLINLSEKEKNTSKKIQLLLEISENYRKIDLDTSIIFIDLAIANFDKKTDKNLKIEVLQSKGKTFLYLGEYENAIISYNDALNLSTEIKNDSLIAQNNHNLGNTHLYMSEYDKALNFYITALKIREKIEDIEGIAATTNNIGLIYWRLKNYDKAVEYYKISLENEDKIGNKKGIGSSLNNIGLLYWSQEKFDEAREYFEKSMQIKTELNDIDGIATAYNNLGLIEKSTENYDKAIVNFKKSLKYVKQLNKIEDIANSYNNLCASYLKLQMLDSAEFYVKKSVQILEETDAKEYLIDAYRYLSDIYYYKNNYKEAYLYLEKYVILKLEVFDETSSEQVAEMETKYETEKKEQEIQLQNLEIEKNNETMKLQQRLIYVFVAFLIITVIFVIFLAFLFRQKKKANQKLELQKAEIFQQKEEIEAQANNLETAYQNISQINEELTQQKKYIEEQNAIIQEANEHTQASIRYALTIQQAILPSQNEISKYFENFVLYRPKDIVSGDFYWQHVEQKNETEFVNYFAVVDCTGHGVPGAFMSMISSRILSSIIKREKIESPAQIITELNSRIVKSLKQNETRNRDGMDMVLCRIEKSDGKYDVTFEGAKRDLIYFTANETNHKILKATRKSVGGINLRKEKVFEDKKVVLNPGDTIYLTTDGYADQNNIERQRYGTKKFIRKLVEIQDKTLAEQFKFLTSEIDSWKSGTTQRDDITVVALKMK